MTSGLHHITAITWKIQANVDFYVGFLGLRLVKRTAGFEDAAQLHLIYGDAVASPGSLMTFLAWEDGSPGRVGHSAPGEISFAIRHSAIGFWLTRALQFGFKATGPALEFGEPVLRLTDPDGIIVKLVGIDDDATGHVWPTRGIAEADGVLTLRGATVFSEKPETTVEFLTAHAGFVRGETEGSLTRLTSEAGGIIDVRDAGGFWTAAPGTGVIDHIAVRMPNRPAVEAAATRLGEGQYGATAVHDRKYFYSLYVREPSGTLIEFASDDPGFTVDEPLEALGETLFIPAHFRLSREDAVPMLPQFGLPDEPRIVYRELPFVHRINEAEAPDGSTLMLLHGSAGNETSLMPFGRRLALGATLVGLRGRSTEEGIARFFRRFADGTFDQQDIRSEVEVLSAFVDGAVTSYGLDPAAMTFVGYSNGANLLAASMLTQPDVVRSAVLLRPMLVLEELSDVSLEGVRVLVVTGSTDPFAPRAGDLIEALQARGATVTHVTVDGGHDLVDEDVTVSRTWLTEPA